MNYTNTRQVRQPRIRGKFPLFSLLTCILCIIAFVVPMFQPDVFFAPWLIPCSRAALDANIWWCVPASMFMHSGVWHLLNNMASLFWVGTSFEKLKGHIAYLFVYFVSGVAGCMLYIRSQTIAGTDVPVVGASGAIFGLFGAYAVICLSYLIKADAMSNESYAASRQLSLLVRVVLWNVIYGFLSPGIANEAHIGGLIGGVICGIVILIVQAIFGRYNRLNNHVSSR